MEAGQIIEIKDYDGEDFKTVVCFEDWKVSYLKYSERFSQFKILERHLKTDEAFVLLNGEATLYVKDDKIHSINMKHGKTYNVKCGVWHHITVSCDAKVLVIENSNTSKENTERMKLNDNI